MSRPENGSITTIGLKRQITKLKRMIGQVKAQAKQLGHDLGEFEVEARWYASVATCKRCRMLAAVDTTESPYTFGLALKRKCK